MGDTHASSSKSKEDLIYALSANDNPGNIITTIKLHGDNYDEWAREIRTSLNAKRKLGFLDGKVDRPTEGDRVEDWGTVHSMLVQWIRNTIDPNIRSTLSCHEDAEELWKTLKDRFCVVNGTRICNLKSAISDCKQKKGESIGDYYGRLCHLWDELAGYEIIPACTGGGGCAVTAFLLQQRAEDRLHRFLIGLDPIFGSIRSSILSQILGLTQFLLQLEDEVQIG